MKVIKRDGRVVDYDRSKISIAIEKANNEVFKDKKASKKDIKTIIEYIEALGKKRILVEDIQDIIEEKLMELGKYELAKKYIVYRYTRALVRKSNTTDESILGLIRKSNRELMDNPSERDINIAAMQRDMIAGEVSKDLSKRILLPEKITEAHNEGYLYFHDMDYFLQPMINSCVINIGDMLDNGTVINGNKIETPKTFQVACNITTQIISYVASNQYGEQSFNAIHLGKYLRKSYEKFKNELTEKYKEKLSTDIIEEITQSRLQYELRQGIQTIFYQINTLITTNGSFPKVTILLHIDPNDKYIKENTMIIEEILKQEEQGIKNEKNELITPEYPKIEYIGEENIKEGTFNQGIVSINLPRIALEVDNDEKKFWKLLSEKLELCREALMLRHYALVGTFAETSPIHWKYGAIARLNTGEKIDKLLYNDYSTISLGYVGLDELSIIFSESLKTKQEEFAKKIRDYLNETLKKWSDETNIHFTLFDNPSKALCQRFASFDKELFGTIEGITDKGYYTNNGEE